MSAKTIELIAGSDLGSTGQTVWQPIPTITLASVYAQIMSAPSGTNPTMSLFLQVTDNTQSGSPFDIPYDQLLVSSAAAGDVTATLDKRNLFTNANSAGKVAALYRHLPAAFVRLAYIIGGTTPVFTVSAVLVGK